MDGDEHEYVREVSLITVEGIEDPPDISFVSKAVSSINNDGAMVEHSRGVTKTDKVRGYFFIPPHEIARVFFPDTPLEKDG
jgi:hypothetical protein